MWRGVVQISKFASCTHNFHPIYLEQQVDITNCIEQSPSWTSAKGTSPPSGKATVHYGVHTGPNRAPEKSSPCSTNLKNFTCIYRTIILPVVLYGCETWSLTLREEHRLRVFENRVLRRIFGPKRHGVTGQWRKLHNKELNDLYSSPNTVRVIKSRRMRWAGHVARIE